MGICTFVNINKRDSIIILNNEKDEKKNINLPKI